MLIIRLARTGRKNNPNFRIVLQESFRAPKAKALEYLGFYNPYLKQKQLDAERIKYWLSQGAQTSDTIHNLLVSEKIIEGSKRKIPTHQKKKGEASEAAETPKAEAPKVTAEPQVETPKQTVPQEAAKPEIKPETPEKTDKEVQKPAEAPKNA